ncbi:hypothetical protein [Kribbella sp. VKM Ac-2568]|uniref:hypothetical protein n=1 Tax=Kribbella sp. VKM Ac-2568 TaxID=2512219 RepID=UPI00104B8655|nr:hypothetical protein [Kribbella sp. VKM Ac-2568]TCM37503.1 hypothetical protein EV648_11952 [Kribbella sp. VKM Ac-2568]
MELRAERRSPPQPQSLKDDAGGQWVRRWTGDDWFAAADAWVRGRLTDAGIVVTGVPVPYKIRFWAAVWCYSTDHGLFWFKENNPGQSFEAALVAAMAQALPQHVVAPLAIEPGYGWMLTADQGPTLDDQVPDADRLPLWRRLVTEYAGLQRATIGVEERLLASGLTSLAPSRLADAVHGVADWFDALGNDHPLRLDRATMGGVRQAGDTLAGWGARLTGAVPMALDQNDLHVHNVFSAHPTAPFRFFDFADAVWGHPFATVASVRAALADPDDSDTWPEDDPRLDQLTDAYLGEWSDLAPLDVLRTELAVAGPLHAVHRMVSWHRLLVHADELEAAAWAESPRYWLDEVIRLFAAHGSVSA